MTLRVVSDLPRSPQNNNLSGEEKKFNELRLLNTALTTTGDESWTSPSSGINYSATTGGQAQLLSLLTTALNNYHLNASDWNSIQNELNNINRTLSMGGMV